MYWTISEEMKFDYYYLMAEGEVPPENVNPYLNSDDMTINIEKAEEIVVLSINKLDFSCFIFQI